jgi:PilZ domain
MQERRGARRQSTAWIGSCHLQGEPRELWRDCGVFDFSTTGVGMDFRHPGTTEFVGRRISVRLAVGGSVDLTFTGQIRNSQPGPDGLVRAGVEFVALTEDELDVIDLLELSTLSDSSV